MSLVLHPASGRQPLLACLGDDHHAPKGPTSSMNKRVDRGTLAVEQRRHAV